ncbi:hypothetical protein H8B13_09020 [Hymenobacter sp. BT188]|uniref:hypothetical protein n=1 Tax=Hymenobacter sp. BT188 TaxID=2763504 RepID=UPI0016519AA9|nr:hypothetical protein [Hymenobacter sp. BT188]MBC6606957.1 hypothetical protein [Hymenobacter sp. BT188]
MQAQQSAITAYNETRAAEVALQRACLVLNIPLSVVQPLADLKIKQAWQAVQQSPLDRFCHTAPNAQL